jgi:hypothetical protein
MVYNGDLPPYLSLQEHDIYLEVIKTFNNVQLDIWKIKFIFGENKGVIVFSNKKSPAPNLKKILLKKNRKVFYNALPQSLAIFRRFGIILEKVECIKALSHLVFPSHLKTFSDLNTFLNKEGLLFEQGFENMNLVRDTIHYHIMQNSLQKQSNDMNTLVDLAVFLQAYGYNIENIMNHGFKRHHF